MTELIRTPQLMFYSIIIPAAAGFILLAWGKALSRRGYWLMALALALAVVGLTLGGVALWQADFKPQVWQDGWIWPRSEKGAITVGILADLAGFVVSVLVLLSGLIFMTQTRLFSNEPRPDRIYAGLGISCSGIAFAWVALTPWFGILGLGLAVLGGFVAQGSRWNSEEEALTAIRFAWERFSGVFLVVLGACGLAVSRDILSWDSFPADSMGNLPADLIGASLLVFGIFMQFQPFPFLGWLNRLGEAPIFGRVVLTLLAPAMAGFSLLFRMEPQLRSIGIFPWFGWVQLSSAFLALCLGFAQNRWRVSFGAWVSAGLSISSAVLALSGQAGGLRWLIGIYLGASVVSCIASIFDGGKPLPNSDNREQARSARVLWAKSIACLGMGAATGAIGFVSADDLVHWLGQSWSQPAIEAVVIFLVFLFVLAGWRLLWRLVRSERSLSCGWGPILSISLLVILSLGVLWNGSVTGGAIPGSLDQVWPSMFSRFFLAGKNLSASMPSPVSMIQDENLSAANYPIYWGIFLISLGVSFWLAGKKPSQTGRPRITALKRVIASGYGVDQGATIVLQSISALGQATERLVDQKIWNDWFPRALSALFSRLSDFATLFDDEMSERMAGLLRQGVDFPAKALQWIQNGDVQWYLVFAVGSAAAIFFHFSKF